METMTNEQIEQKKQLLVEKVKEMKVIYDELVEAGAIELNEDELDKAAGGFFEGYGYVDPGEYPSKEEEPFGQFFIDLFTGKFFTKDYWKDL